MKAHKYWSLGALAAMISGKSRKKRDSVSEESAE